MTDAVNSRDSLPVLETHDVVSLVSDSGVIRYRITSPLWLVYDRLDPSMWAFEKGVYLESFDSLDHVEASVEADTAYYYDKKSLWELRGNVQIKNMEGEEFSSDQMFWNQETQKIYSDRHIRILQKDRVITGKGFESNQQMTVYTIRYPEGIFYVDNEQAQAQNPDSLSTSSEQTP